ncbi:RING finger protein 214 isoform X1 [Pleurodeles waltl]|uniref:RING finger protein 214 isoform X1 n=1 Tax=Pleurodeles waltl TaxID=8319 RepID=UPI003709624E
MEVEEKRVLTPSEVIPLTIEAHTQMTLEDQLMNPQTQKSSDAAEEEYHNSIHSFDDQEVSQPTLEQGSTNLLDLDGGKSNNASVQTDFDETAFDELVDGGECTEEVPGDCLDDETYYSIPDEFSEAMVPNSGLIGQLPFIGPMDLYRQAFGHDPSPLYFPVGKQITVGGAQAGDWIELKTCHSISIQTDFESRDFSINTEDIIEKNLEKMISERMRLKESYQEVLDKQRQVESQLHVQLRQLQQRREEEKKIHKEIVKGIQDATIKREETKKKMERERKDFSSKEPELKMEIEKLREKNERLLKEQEEKENKVVSLVAEQSEEKEAWEEELAELKKQYSEISRSVVEETERALEAEVMSLESRKELLFLRLTEAENEAKVRLAVLSRSVPESREIKQLKQEWEQRLMAILTNKEKLLEQFKQHIELVRNGAKLCTLPELAFPILPAKPNPRVEADLTLQATQQFNPSLQQRMPFPVAPGAQMLLSQSTPLHPVSQGVNHPGLASAPHNSQVLLPTSNVPLPVLGVGKGSTLGAPGPPANKLGKILERLMARYPQCNQTQLTQILQQIKTSRGTTAGLSFEDLCKLVGMQLAERHENPPGIAQSLGQIGSHVFNAPHSRVNPTTFLPATQAVGLGRPPQPTPNCKLCLMCQKIVQPKDVHPMTCAHVLHRECIQFWAKRNQNESCPFCPAAK